MGLAVMKLCARGRPGVYGEDDGFNERGMKGDGRRGKEMEGRGEDGRRGKEMEGRT